MRTSAITGLRLAALACLTAGLVAIAAVAFAQIQSQTVNRENVPPGEATPTGASFSVDFPVPYADVTVMPAEGSGPIRMVTGVSPEHVVLTASQFDIQPGRKMQPLDDFMKHASEKAGAKPSDVTHDHDKAAETLSFGLIDLTGGGSLYRVIRTANAQYVLVVQFQPAQRDNAATYSDPFFGSFKLIGQ